MNKCTLSVHLKITCDEENNTERKILDTNLCVTKSEDVLLTFLKIIFILMINTLQKHYCFLNVFVIFVSISFLS